MVVSAKMMNHKHPNSSFSSSPTRSSSPRKNPHSTVQSHRSSPVCFLLCFAALVGAQFILLPFYLSHHVILEDSDSGSSSSSSKFLSKHDGAKTRRRSREQEQQQEQQQLWDKNDVYRDGTFNGLPLRLITTSKPPSSRVHCVGENYEPNAWMQRSCRFEFLCFNTTAQEFVTWESSQEALLSSFVRQRDATMHVSSTLVRSLNGSQTVAIGGLNQKWGKKGKRRLEWFPIILNKTQIDSVATTVLPTGEASSWSYYELPPSVIMLPYHSLNGANPGHLVWDDFLPLYTILQMFQFDDINQDNNHQLLLLRYVLPPDARTGDERGLWASCDMNENKTRACHAMMTKFAPLLLGRRSNQSANSWSNTRNFAFEPSSRRQTHDSATAATSDLVCAKTGLAGLGSLTDHGIVKSHGWEPEDYLTTHNHGRGGLLHHFRNFCLRNLGIFAPVVPRTAPHRVVFSQGSSDIWNRNLNFEVQIKAVQQYVPMAHVEAHVLKHLALQDQMELVSQAAVYVTLCGGGAVTGMFLPKGASVILYYDATGGAKNNHLTGLPARLDWDLYNSLTHVRVHWLPRKTMDTRHDLNTLVLLIRHELKAIEEGAFLSGGGDMLMEQDNDAQQASSPGR